jgi:hypothetical protein
MNIMKKTFRIASFVVGLILFTDSVLIPAIAQAQSTPSSINKNINSEKILTPEEINVDVKNTSEEDINNADAESEAAIRTLAPDITSPNNVNTGIQKKPGIYSPNSIQNETLDSGSSIELRSQNVLSQVNYLLAISAVDFWYISQNSRSNYSGRIDWETDFCTWSQDTGLYFDFEASCAHHDFGYANYQKLNVWNEKTKKYVDAIFYRDMKAHCSTRSIFFKTDCYARAYVYYKFVRKFGK